MQPTARVVASALRLMPDVDMTSICQVGDVRDTRVLSCAACRMSRCRGVARAVQAAEQTAHPSAVRAGGRVVGAIGVTDPGAGVTPRQGRGGTSNTDG